VASERDRASEDGAQLCATTTARASARAGLVDSPRWVRVGGLSASGTGARERERIEVKLRLGSRRLVRSACLPIRFVLRLPAGFSRGVEATQRSQTTSHAASQVLRESEWTRSGPASSRLSSAPHTTLASRQQLVPYRRTLPRHAPSPRRSPLERLALSPRSTRPLSVDRDARRQAQLGRPPRRDPPEQARPHHLLPRRPPGQLAPRDRRPRLARPHLVHRPHPPRPGPGRCPLPKAPLDPLGSHRCAPPFPRPPRPHPTLSSSSSSSSSSRNPHLTRSPPSPSQASSCRCAGTTPARTSLRARTTASS